MGGEKGRLGRSVRANWPLPGLFYPQMTASHYKLHITAPLSVESDVVGKVLFVIQGAAIFS
jgi:hypothetical protein